MTCPNCEYHKARAARWRAEAYRQAGHDVIELPWVGLTDVEIKRIGNLDWDSNYVGLWYDFAKAIEAKLKEKNT